LSLQHKIEEAKINNQIDSLIQKAKKDEDITITPTPTAERREEAHSAYWRIHQYQNAIYSTIRLREDAKDEYKAVVDGINLEKPEDAKG